MNFAPKVILCIHGKGRNVDRRKGDATVSREGRNQECAWEKRARDATRRCFRKRPPCLAGSRPDFQGSKVSLYFTYRLADVSYHSGDKFRLEAS